MTHPYVEGGIAAALREVERCLEHLKTSFQTTGPEAWKSVAVAQIHASTARAQLDDTMQLIEQIREAAE